MKLNIQTSHCKLNQASGHADQVNAEVHDLWPQLISHAAVH